MAASETLKVLRAAVQLGEFTQPELAVVSGASYEMVKKVLRAERDERTVEQLDRTVGGTKGRPRVMWRVIDRAAIQARLDSSRRDAEGDAEAWSTPGEVPLMYSPLDTALSAAEDRLVFALRARNQEDCAGFARDALAELGPYGDELKADDRGRRQGQKRNLPLPVGRADVTAAMAGYLASAEARGPLWRQAFDAIRAFDNAPQAWLHKLFLVALVDMADRRAPRTGPLAAPVGDVGSWPEGDDAHAGALQGVERYGGG